MIVSVEISDWFFPVATVVFLAVYYFIRWIEKKERKL